MTVLESTKMKQKNGMIREFWGIQGRRSSGPVIQLQNKVAFVF